MVLSGLCYHVLLTALLPHCHGILLWPSLTCLQERTRATILQASGEAKASWLRPRVSGESMEGTEGLVTGGAMGSQHSPDEAGSLSSFSQG